MTPDQIEELKKIAAGERPKYNRAQRRKKPPTDNWFTKASHKIKKIRKNNAKTKQQHQRELARARKARKENNQEIS